MAPKRFENVAVLFVDLVSFTAFCDRHTPEEVVDSLGDLFVLFEECAKRNGLEKIKTVGDAFLATAGLLKPVPDPLGGGCELRPGDCRRSSRHPRWLGSSRRCALRGGDGRHRGPGALSIRYLGRYGKRGVASEFGGITSLSRNGGSPSCEARKQACVFTRCR